MSGKIRLAAAVVCLCILLLSGCGAGAGVLSQSQRSKVDSVLPDAYSKVSGSGKQLTPYYYGFLNEDEKLWYDDMVYIIAGMSEKTALNKIPLEHGLGEEDLNKIFGYVMNDHPEFFYLDGFVYTTSMLSGKLIEIEFTGTYTMDRKEAERRAGEIKSAVNEILSAAPSGEAYVTEKYVYETIIADTEYNLYASDNQNIYSVLVNHQSVCQGYAKSFQYLMQQMGIPCILVSGSVNTGETHAWDCVEINGRYYLTDPTWGDPSYIGNQSTAGIPEISYDFLNVTSKELSKSHFASDASIIPDCLSGADNYYAREGRLFYSYDEVLLQSLFAAMDARGYVNLKCETDDLFDYFQMHLINKAEVLSFVNKGQQMHYYTNDKLRTMTFWMTN